MLEFFIGTTTIIVLSILFFELGRSFGWNQGSEFNAELWRKHNDRSMEIIRRLSGEIKRLKSTNDDADWWKK